MNADLMRQNRQLFARVAGWAQTSRSTSLGKNDECDGRGSQKGGIPVRRVWPFGLRSVPPDGSEGILLTLNGGRRSGGAAVLIAAENLKYGPDKLEGGETALYSQFDAVVLLDKAGNIKITAKSGADVVVNGGSANVGRVGDEVGWLVLQFTPTMVGQVCTLVYWSAVEPLLPPLPTALPPPASTYKQQLKITKGAEHFKG